MEPLGMLLVGLEAQPHIPEDARTWRRTCPHLRGGCPGSLVSPHPGSAAPRSHRSVGGWGTRTGTPCCGKACWEGNKALRAGCWDSPRHRCLVSECG